MQPSLDHYYGREVIEVVEAENGERAIRLAGDVLIHNHSDVYPKPSIPGGVTLQSMTMAADRTTIHFGTNSNPMQIQVNLDPMRYSISDPQIEEGNATFPQRSGFEGLEDDS
jgi:hypothetical protein